MVVNGSGFPGFKIEELPWRRFTLWLIVRKRVVTEKAIVAHSAEGLAGLLLRNAHVVYQFANRCVRLRSDSRRAAKRSVNSEILRISIWQNSCGGA